MGLPCQERGFLPPSALAKGAGGGFQRSFNGWGETGATIAFGDCPPPPLLGAGGPKLWKGRGFRQRQPTAFLQIKKKEWGYKVWKEEFPIGSGSRLPFLDCRLRGAMLRSFALATISFFSATVKLHFFPFLSLEAAVSERVGLARVGFINFFWLPVKMLNSTFLNVEQPVFIITIRSYLCILQKTIKANSFCLIPGSPFSVLHKNRGFGAANFCPACGGVAGGSRKRSFAPDVSHGI